MRKQLFMVNALTASKRVAVPRDTRHRLSERSSLKQDQDEGILNFQATSKGSYKATAGKVMPSLPD
jgi:hypothetical protein